MSSPIRQWPLHERPREKLLTRGAQTLSDAELLAIFFRTGIKGKTAVDLARDTLKHFGSLRHLLEINSDEFCQTHGLGTAKYVMLKAALEIAQRYLHQTLQHQDTLKNPQETQRYLAARLRHYSHEVFACLFLDSQHRVICFEELFTGTIDSATVYLRTIVKKSIFHNAAALIVAHNHPSGHTEPSEADKDITRQLIQILQLIDVRLLDHIIIGEGPAFSFCEHGLMA